MKNLQIQYLFFTKNKKGIADVLYDLEKNYFEIIPYRLSEKLQIPFVIFFDSESSTDKMSELIKEIQQSSIEPKIIAISIDTVPKHLSWQLLKIGVNEVFAWFTTVNPVVILKSRLSYWKLADEKVRFLQKSLVGESKVWLQTLHQIVDIAISDSAVLIWGESGTGKELVARKIHELDKREEKKDYIVVDCTNLMPNLSGSELFGHEKGSFTNAISMREGAIELANNGTLFLDELGELPIALQAELLRVLQEKTFKRVGSNVWRKVSFRLISATNRNLEDEIKKGNFRQDLFYRISGWTCRLPNLDERKEDIPVLAKHFFKEIYHRTQIDEQVLEFLSLRTYQGNIRELQQLVSRIANKHIGDGPITIGDIPQSDWPDFDKLHTKKANTENELEQLVKEMLYNGVSLRDLKDMIGDIAKREAIDHERGNLRMAAQRLGCSQRILQMHKKGSNLKIHKSA